MKVLKFGGTSVASAPIIRKVTRIVTAAARQEKVILVTSAISKCTDTLIKIGAEAAEGNSSYKAQVYSLRCIHRRIIGELLEGSAAGEALKECDAAFDGLDRFADAIYAARSISAEQAEAIQTFGELFSTRIIARKLAADGCKVLWIDSREIIRTEDGAVRFDLTCDNIRVTLEAHPDIDIFVAPGFIATDLQGRRVTLGRGGSDYSAAIYAAGSHARIVEIWTDVPGIMTTDPKMVPTAVTIPYLSYRAARDMAEFGAKVLYPPTVTPAQQAGIPICILNTYDPEAQGSFILDNPPHRASGLLGLTCLKAEALARVADGVEKPALEVSEGDVVLAIIGTGEEDGAAVEQSLVRALDRAGIKAKGTARTECNVFAVVSAEDKRDALLAVHRRFFESKPVKVINTFLAGYGAVGQAFIEMIKASGDTIAERTGKRIRIVGVSSSRKYILNADGIKPEDIATVLPYGHPAEGGAFFDAIGSLALKNAVLLDCTNSESIGARYEEFFRRGLHVVSCNRRAFAVPYARYAAMKSTAHDYGLALKYDTTVGTALPILESIAGSAYSGDEITAIEAVVSCTLNNILTSYDGANTEPFGTLLRQAQDIGLTEKDPRADLGGRDALRKLLILAREAGVPLEESDVEITPMLGPEFFDCPIETFYERLAAYEPKFIAREAELDDLGMRQRFVASIRKDPSARLGYKAEIKMQLFGMDSPFFWISGTENVVIIRSAYSAPLVIRGAGEGARMAASGVINNLLTL